MYKVLNGAVHHKGEVYRKGDELPDTFTNKEGYRHVEEIEDKPEKKKPGRKPKSAE